MTNDDREREADWKAGWHTNADGIRLRLADMNYEHLENTIKLFSYLNVRPLRSALRRKQRKFVPVVIEYLVRRETAGRKVGSSNKAKRRGKLAKAAREAIAKFTEA
jgi:hypothetical protein